MEPGGAPTGPAEEGAAKEDEDDEDEDEDDEEADIDPDEASMDSPECGAEVEARSDLTLDMAVLSARWRSRQR